MIRASHTIYRIVCSLLPEEWEVRPPLCWLWDEDEVVKIAKINVAEREAEQGYSARALYALWDPIYVCIFAPMGLADATIARQVLIYLHELAHANGYEAEDAADEAALKMYRRIARRSVWAQKGIALKVRRRQNQSEVVDDLVYSIPARLPPYMPW